MAASASRARKTLMPFSTVAFVLFVSFVVVAPQQNNAARITITITTAAPISSATEIDSSSPFMSPASQNPDANHHHASISSTRPANSSAPRIDRHTSAPNHRHP